MIGVEGEILKYAIDSNQLWTIILITLSVIIIPMAIKFIHEYLLRKYLNQLIYKQDILLSEQRDINTHMLKFLDSKMRDHELNINQITSIFNGQLDVAEQKLIEQVRLTLKLNNIRDKKYTMNKISMFTKEILTEIFDRMSWFKYKGINANIIINQMWIKTVEYQIENFIYDNNMFDKMTEMDKTKYYDFDVLRRNLKLVFKEFENTYSKKLSMLKSDIETKLESYG